jgi:hypothetical protein
VLGSSSTPSANSTRRSAPHPPRPANSSRLWFVLTWKDGAAFHGRIDLERPGTGLIEHVTRACRAALQDPQLHVLLAGARLTVERLFETALAERIAGLTRPSQEDPWNA